MTGRKPKRILAIHRYYSPDTAPYATMLQCIVNQWHEDGFKVDVLSALPSYKASVEHDAVPQNEELPHGKVIRLNLPSEAGRPVIRVLNALKLCAAIFWYGLVLRRYSAIMISTSPPVMGGFVAMTVAKLTRSKFIYHCMDIHPEIGNISGEFSNPLVHKCLGFLDSLTCQFANVVVVLSEDMKRSLSQRKRGHGFNIAILNNFSLPDDVSVGGAEIEINPDKFTILFAGNIGRFQGLQTLVAAMAELAKNDEIEAVFMGDGQARGELELMAGRTGANIRFVGHHPVAVAKSAMTKTSIGYVSLVEGVCKYAYPSKTTVYLEQACPLLVSMESNASLAESVVENKLGVVVPPGNALALAACITELAADPRRVKQYRESAALYGAANFSPAVVLPAWSNLISRLLM